MSVPEYDGATRDGVIGRAGFGSRGNCCVRSGMPEADFHDAAGDVGATVLRPGVAKTLGLDGKSDCRPAV
jgi:hypothetical protein